MKIVPLVLFCMLSTLILVNVTYAGVGVQTQPSSDGTFEMKILSVKQADDVLTIKAMIRNITDERAKVDLDFNKIYYTDLKNQRKYLPIRDEKGGILAGPIDVGSSGLLRQIDRGKVLIVWMKFPAPPPNVMGIDFFVPEFLPFEKIPMTRAQVGSNKGKAQKGGGQPARPHGLTM